MCYIYAHKATLLSTHNNKDHKENGKMNQKIETEPEITEEQASLKSLGGKLIERSRLVNIWKAEIEFYERRRRFNGAAVIAVRHVPRSTRYSYDDIIDYIIESLRYDDLYTQFNERTSLIDTWGKDLDILRKKCKRLRNNIPLNSNGEKEFDLEFSIVSSIPFDELHHTDTLKQVMHRVLELLELNQGQTIIPHDDFLDMEKTVVQAKRMEKYEVPKHGPTKARERIRELQAAPGTPPLQ